jgi:hypothetical protein
MPQINTTNYPNIPAASYGANDMLLYQKDGGDTRTTKPSDIKAYANGSMQSGVYISGQDVGADLKALDTGLKTASDKTVKIGTPVTGEYTDATNTNAQNIKALDDQLKINSDALGDKISEPATDGTLGQVLTTDGAGGRSWETVQGGSGGMSHSVITIAAADWTADSYTSSSGTSYAYKAERAISGMTAAGYVDASITGSNRYDGVWCVENESTTGMITFRIAEAPTSELQFNLNYSVV